MKNTYSSTICIALTVVLCLAAAVPAYGISEKEKQLLAVLTSDDSPRADKAITCKRLAIYGSEASVPALAKLLSDKELASWARTALEVIPGEKADKALRDAMEKLEGRLLIGVINSIAVRRDEKAVKGLAGHLNGSPADVASAAAAALGRIGTDDATEILFKALKNPPKGAIAAVAEGCILCAEKLLASGETGQAEKCYQAVYTTEVPKQRKIEAVRGMILAQHIAGKGVPLLVTQLTSKDKDFFRLGLTLSRELKGEAVTKALTQAMIKSAKNRQGYILLALSDGQDASALPAVLTAAKEGSKEIKMAAFRILGEIGDATCLPVLLDAALQDDKDLAETAAATLQKLPGEKVDGELLAALGKAKGQKRVLLIELAGTRGIEGAASDLIKAAEDDGEAVRSAALTALGLTAGPRHLDFLISRAVDPENESDKEPAMKALRTACLRMPDREACAAKLTDAFERVPETTQNPKLERRWDRATKKWIWVSGSTQSRLLEILGAMGGEKALETVEAASKDSADPALQDTAVRLLGSWLSPKAAPVLLDLAKSATSAKHKQAALTGYVRIIQEFTLPAKKRIEMCRAALKTAQRKAEYILILNTMKKYPGLGMLRLAVEAAKNNEIKAQAAEVMMVIAQKIGGKSADVKRLLAQVKQEPVKIEIIKAEYGAGNKNKDVTGVLKKHAGGFPLIILPSESYNAAFGGDPVPGTVKQLKIHYRMNGKEGRVTLQENAPVMLPVPE